MCKSDLTEILCVLDKSGSMFSLRRDVIGGFNTFIEDQKKVPGEAHVTLTLFDTKTSIVYNSLQLKDIPVLNEQVYMPGGGTALLDAIGETIVKAGKEFDLRSDAAKPGKVIMLIMTDGQENSSTEYSKTTIRNMIEQQQKEWSWEFVFVGANIDAFSEAASIGISASNTANFAARGQNVAAAYKGMSRSVASYRVGGSASLDSTQY